jgi:hypothetical protein
MGIVLDLADKIPCLSEIEEARALQYRCECIESACLDQGKGHRLPSNGTELF